jgi:hypothetical protein
MAAFSASTQARTNATGRCGFVDVVSDWVGDDVTDPVLAGGLGAAEGSSLHPDVAIRIAAASRLASASRSDRT